MPNMVKDQAYIGNVNELVQHYRDGDLSVTLVVITLVVGYVVWRIGKAFLKKAESHFYATHPDADAFRRASEELKVRRSHHQRFGQLTLGEICDLLNPKHNEQFIDGNNDD